MLDLDHQEVLDFEFERVESSARADEGGPPGKEMRWLWLGTLLRFALQARATAVHLLYDSEERCLRQLIHQDTPHEQSVEGWLELVPMIGSFRNSGVAAVRDAAAFQTESNQGTLRYSYNDKIHEAVCVQLNDTTW